MGALSLPGLAKALAVEKELQGQKDTRTEGHLPLHATGIALSQNRRLPWLPFLPSRVLRLPPAQQDPGSPWGVLRPR